MTEGKRYEVRFDATVERWEVFDTLTKMLPTNNAPTQEDAAALAQELEEAAAAGKVNAVKGIVERHAQRWWEHEQWQTEHDAIHSS